MIRHTFLIFSILVSVAVTLSEAATTAAYNPTDVFLFNCGDTSNNTDNTGWNWTAENLKSLPWNSVNASFSSNANFQESGVPLIPYMKARIFLSDFTYSFSVTPGPKFLRLYFYPTRYGSDFDADNFFFSVTVNNDFTLLKNSSADLMVKASKDFTLIKGFIVPVDQTTLKLTFRPSPKSLAFVNGIEIVSMPDGFYSKGGFDDRTSNTGSTIDFQIQNSTVFETLYRLNVAGQTVRDTGMFRRWISDDEFILESMGTVPIVPGVKIKYTEKTPAYVAPEDVYATCRMMGNPENPKLNLNFSLTWLFPVDAGFNYLVRLHFCEIIVDVTGPEQRVFSIFITNQVAKRKMDVMELSGGTRIPVYLDVSVYVGSQSDLQLDLRPFIDFNPTYLDAILNGVEILKMNDSKGNLAGPNPAPRTLGDIITLHETSRWKRVATITAIVVGSTIGLAILVVVFMLLMRFMKRKKNRKENSVVMSKVLLKHYTFTELKKITKSIGKGGFGTVYGGKLCKGRKVAVKVLKDSKGNGEDFINEVASMSQTSHINIVSMLGFCFEGSKRAIIYGFLENGSLDQFLSRNNSSSLNATTLYGIALGISRGLEYLHYGCKTRIVHFDIKPQNILLDDNLCPKVSDFGLAKLCEKRESILSLMDARGTIGYIAPEVFSRMYGGISHKSDVYSYGMLVLEMIGARNKEIAETITPNASSSYFPDWIYKDLENGDQQTWIFGDEITEEEKEIVKKMILVSLWCIQPCPLDRPPMNRVVEMMEGSLDALEVPPKPSMHISTRLISESSSFPDDIESPSSNSKES